jgi:hypothetical protein
MRLLSIFFQLQRLNSCPNTSLPCLWNFELLFFSKFEYTIEGFSRVKFPLRIGFAKKWSAV